MGSPERPSNSKNKQVRKIERLERLENYGWKAERIIGGLSGIESVRSIIQYDPNRLIDSGALLFIAFLARKISLNASKKLDGD